MKENVWKRESRQLRAMEGNVLRPEGTGGRQPGTGPPRTQWQSGVTAAQASCPERAAPRKPLFPTHWSWLLTTLERSGKQRCREAEVTELSLRQVTLDLCTLGALRRAARPPSWTGPRKLPRSAGRGRPHAQAHCEGASRGRGS